MNQNINIEQLGELSVKGREYLDFWWAKRKNRLHNWGMKELFGETAKEISVEETIAEFDDVERLPILTIGHMIEFIDEHRPDGWWHIERHPNRKTWRVMFELYACNVMGWKELNEALWEIVAYIIEYETEHHA